MQWRSRAAGRKNHRRGVIIRRCDEKKKLCLPAGNKSNLPTRGKATSTHREGKYPAGKSLEGRSGAPSKPRKGAVGSPSGDACTSERNTWKNGRWRKLEQYRMHIARAYSVKLARSTRPSTRQDETMRAMERVKPMERREN